MVDQMKMDLTSLLLANGFSEKVIRVLKGRFE